jgi:phosphonopyruvate decarboxylase
MIDSYQFLDHLTARGLRFFSGVPDSVLSGLCAGINNRLPATDHVVAPNEGAAIALGAGHYLATGTPPVIYLQNAGLGNIVNPVVSLVSPGVYGMPMLLIIGWRGEMYEEDGTTAQLPDEPQHHVQGRITLGQLELMDIPYEVLDAGRQEWRKSVDRMIDRLRTDNGPAALVVRKDTFSKVALPKSAEAGAARLNREEAISCCLKSLPETVPVVATTGMAAREVFELRAQSQQGHHRDFLCIGAMGLASQVAAGIALGIPNSRVACIDGDGALLMHMGSMAVCAGVPNLVHIVMNNEAHESVGGHPSAACGLDLSLVARTFGYKVVRRVTSAAELEQALAAALAATGSAFIEILCAVGHRADLGRPTIPPTRGKEILMEFLGRLSLNLSNNP